MDLEKSRGLTIAELKNEVVKLRKELMELRIKRATNQLKNPHQQRHTRRDIARLLTIIAEKERQDKERARAK